MDFWRLVSSQQFATPPIEAHHNHWVMFGAILLAILAAGVFIPTVQHYSAAKKEYRTLWLVAGSVSMGMGIWAMHFTSMLSYHLHGPVLNYDALITLISLIPAILATAGCILLLKKAESSNRYLFMSAVMMAAGIGLMHYMGMEAIEVERAEMYYQPLWFFASLIIAFMLAWLALYTHTRVIKTKTLSMVQIRIISATTLGLAVSAMHFFAMEATYFQATSTLAITGHHPMVSYMAMIVAIVIISIGLVTLFFIGLAIDQRISKISHSLEVSEDRFSHLSESSPAAIFTVESGIITYANPALGKMMVTSVENIQGRQVARLLGHDFNRLIYSLDDAPDEDINIDYPVVTVTGKNKWLNVSLCQIETDHGRQALVTAVDISKQKTAENHMRDLAYTDPLTQLGNRSKCVSQLNTHLAGLKFSTDSDEGITAVMMQFDLDGFKSINEVNGQHFGDKVLMEVAKRLHEIEQNNKLISRVGGDEFAILIEEDMDSSRVYVMAQSIFSQLIEPYHVDGHTMHLTMSMGVVMVTPAYLSADEVLQDVDVALYRAKQEHDACWMLFDEQLDAKTKRSRQLLPELTRAIHHKELAFYYQPIVDTHTHEIKGFEALARWQRSSNGEWVSPGEFIPLAEGSGLIAEIGLWAVECAVRQISQWRENSKAFEGLYISVNIATLSFSDERFYDAVAALFNEYDIKPGTIRLELTERTLVDDPIRMSKKLSELLKLGCDLMIDDFGTGYSSLSYLHKLPISTLKVDRSFVSDLIENEGTETVVRTIISLADNLSMHVVAEGVETLAQANKLKEMGVDMLQGYYFAKPLPVDDVIDYVADSV